MKKFFIFLILLLTFNYSIANTQLEVAKVSESNNTKPQPDNIIAQKQTNQQLTYKPLQQNESLQDVINNLTDKDRKIVLEIQQEISTWPKKLINELVQYREFVLMLRKQAEDKYNKLSPQAKKAFTIENNMKSKLSKEAVEALEKAHVNN